MKKLSIILAAVLVLSTNIFAQNNIGKSDDFSRITLAAVVSDDVEGLTASSKEFLKNRLNQIASKYGMGGAKYNERFIITSNVLILSKNITPSAPPQHVYDLEVSFFVGDGIDGKLFASTSKTLKGVGTTETKAYKMALNNIKISDTIFESLFEQSKNKIIEYYNGNCDIIIKEAKTLATINEYDASIYKLMSVPSICKQCYDKAFEELILIYNQKNNFECDKKILEAKIAWNSGLDSYSADKASEYLIQINPNSNCYEDAQLLIDEISKRILELDNRKWEIKQTEFDLENSRINAIREIGVEYGKNQPKNVTYNYKSWW